MHDTFGTLCKLHPSKQLATMPIMGYHQTWRTKTMTKAIIHFALTITHNFPSLYARLLPIARQYGLIGQLTLCKKG